MLKYNDKIVIENQQIKSYSLMEDQRYMLYLKECLLSENFTDTKLLLWERDDYYIILIGYELLEACKRENIDIHNNVQFDVVYGLNDLSSCIKYVLQVQMNSKWCNSIRRSYMRNQLCDMIKKMTDMTQLDIVNNIGISSRTLKDDRSISKALEMMTDELKWKILNSNTSSPFNRCKLIRLSRFNNVPKNSIKEEKDLEYFIGKESLQAEKGIELLISCKKVKERFLEMSKRENVHISTLIRTALLNYLNKYDHNY